MQSIGSLFVCEQTMHSPHWVAALVARALTWSATQQKLRRAWQVTRENCFVVSFASSPAGRAAANDYYINAKKTFGADVRAVKEEIKIVVPLAGYDSKQEDQDHERN